MSTSGKPEKTAVVVVASSDHQQEQQHGDSETAAAATALTSFVSAKNSNKKNSAENEFEIPQKFTKSGRKRAVPFPMKLMKVLSNKEFADIITWTPSGNAFTIRQPKAFTAQILPDHFKSAKYSSFTRKLHRWGFMRHYRGDESGAFYHKDFQKDRLDLAEQMSCLKSEPPKAPLAMKTSQPKPSPPQPAETEVSVAATKPQATEVARPVAPKAAPVARLERPALQQPIPQPANVIARLQQQQQTLKTADLAAERLNAAIEAEVTRRLNERIQAAQKAALSRLALVQHLGAGHPSRAIPTPPAIPLPSVPQHRPVRTAAPPAARQQWNMAAGSLKTQLLLLQQKKQSLAGSSDASCLGLSAPAGGMPRIDKRGLDELPRTNIQGAKTA